jgi:putative transposase
MRHAVLRTSKELVRRLMRENGLSATSRLGRPRGARNHDGTIILETIDIMWGTDMIATFTLEHGQVAVFIAVDHASDECVGIHVALHGTRHEALEPVRQGVAECFGSVENAAAESLTICPDHGSQYMSRDFQREIAWRGAAVVFIRTLKENLLGVRTIRTIEELCLATDHPPSSNAASWTRSR